MLAKRFLDSPIFLRLASRKKNQDLDGMHHVTPHLTRTEFTLMSAFDAAARAANESMHGHRAGVLRLPTCAEVLEISKTLPIEQKRTLRHILSSEIRANDHRALALHFGAEQGDSEEFYCHERSEPLPVCFVRVLDF